MPRDVKTMPEKNLNTINESAYTGDASENEDNNIGDYQEEMQKEDNYQNILNESFLLNNDIFSFEFENETKIEDTKDSNDLKSQELKTDSEDSAFILSVEENIEETDIHRNKREFNEYMRRIPERKRKGKIVNTNVLQEKHKVRRYAPQINKRPDKSEKEYGSRKEIETSKYESRDRFDVIRAPVNTKVRKIKKRKSILFKISEMEFRGFHQKNATNMEIDLKKIDADKKPDPIEQYEQLSNKTSYRNLSKEILSNDRKYFSMDFDQKEHSHESVRKESEVMRFGFDEIDKMPLKKEKENRLKIGGV